MRRIDSLRRDASLPGSVTPRRASCDASTVGMVRQLPESDAKESSICER
jgi:hypothetical protein